MHGKQRYSAAWCWEEKAARNLPFSKRFIIHRITGAGNLKKEKKIGQYPLSSDLKIWNKDFHPLCT